MTEFSSIGDIFPSQTVELVSDGESRVIQDWTSSLHHVVGELARREGFVEGATQQINEAIDLWALHPDHGARHSYYVYEGMKWLVTKEGRLNEVDDSALQAMAVLHDLMQAVPLVDPKTGNAFGGNQRKLHAKAMATAVSYYGRRLGLPEEETTDLAFSIRHHDDVYEGIANRPFSYAGQLLSDADKLFGAGLSRDPKELARGAMLRNLGGVSGSQGWYFFRGDIGKEERQAWRYGDRWLVDAVASVQADIFRLSFYTNGGKEIGRTRREAFFDLIDTVYGGEYDKTVKALSAWRDSVERGDEATILLVGKDQTPEPIVGGRSISQEVKATYNRPLSLKPQYLRDGLEPRGWKILFGETVIDPTIARFVFNEDDQFEPREGRRRFVSELTTAFSA